MQLDLRGHNGCVKSICAWRPEEADPRAPRAQRDAQQRKRPNTRKVVLRFRACGLNTLKGIINVAQSSPVAAGTRINLQQSLLAPKTHRNAHESFQYSSDIHPRRIQYRIQLGGTPEQTISHSQLFRPWKPSANKLAMLMCESVLIFLAVCTKAPPEHTRARVRARPPAVLGYC